jgi:hypothetical protein
MIDENAKSQGSHAETDAARGGRSRYSSPVLTHLGSVNRLTLAQTSFRWTDGSKRLPKII